MDGSQVDCQLIGHGILFFSLKSPMSLAATTIKKILLMVTGTSARSGNSQSFRHEEANSRSKDD